MATPMHYPMDTSLFGDGARVLTRTMRRIQEEVGPAGTKVRSGMLSVTHRLFEIGRAGRGQGEAALPWQRERYQKLMGMTRQVVGHVQGLPGRCAR